MTARSDRAGLARPLPGTGLTAEWQDWLATNLARGCAPIELTEILVANGHAPALAAVAVEALARRTAPGQQAAGRPELRGVLRRIGSPATLVLTDRLVHLAARLERPAVAVLGGFLSSGESETLIALSKAKLARSTVVNPATGQADENRDRSSEGTCFAIGENDLVARLERRLAELTGWPVEHGEGIQVLRYGPGGQYKPHYDYFPEQDPGSLPHLAKGGQRVATVVMYLNDVAAGGETNFPNAGGLRVLPRQGWATCFSNCDADGRPDPLTLHGGAPVLAGEKWIATKWIREKPYR